MKRFVLVVLILGLTGFLFAQEGIEVGATDPERLSIDSAQQLLKEISVDKFEKDGYWHSAMSSDNGYVTTRLFEGAPAGKEALAEEEGLDIPDRYVLGSRVDFLHRGHTSFTLFPQRPIPIEGITKTVSVWAVGRNYNHELYLLVQDFFGRPFELYMGKLNFQGWKQLTVAIPPQAEDGRNGIVQRNYHYNNNLGIKITGLMIKCDPLEAFGSYYVYFDDLRAVTDLFAEDNRDEDDMNDTW
ncbi:MAG: flagellar filament outer layer protein FlaA [Treponema sp.]|nr:flagellar filament outer layer protein FlaA [Treponema sp.]